MLLTGLGSISNLRKMKNRKKLLTVFFLFAVSVGMAHSLIIYRPENHSSINEVRCYLRIEDTDGNDVTYTAAKAYYAWYYEPKKLYPYQKSYFISGGMAMHLYLKPGIYNITVYTPAEHISDFPSIPEDKKSTWNSNTFTYNTENPLNVLFISPVADENGFTYSGWHLDYKAPKYFKFTKPYLSQ